MPENNLHAQNLRWNFLLEYIQQWW